MSSNASRRRLQRGGRPMPTPSNDIVQVPCSPLTSAAARPGPDPTQRISQPPLLLFPNGASGPAQPAQQKSANGNRSTQLESLKLSLPTNLVDSPFVLTPQSLEHRFDFNDDQTQASVTMSGPDKGRVELESTMDDRASVIEVPATSPLQNDGKSPYFNSGNEALEKADVVDGVLASSPFRSGYKVPRSLAVVDKLKSRMLSSDDEVRRSSILRKAFPDDGSSDDSDAMQRNGDIKPTIFSSKDNFELSPKKLDLSCSDSSSTLGKTKKRQGDYLADVKDFLDIQDPHIRLLAKKVKKSAGSAFSAAQCLDALLTASHDVGKAVAKLRRVRPRTDRDVEPDSHNMASAKAFLVDSSLPNSSGGSQRKRFREDENTHTYDSINCSDGECAIPPTGRGASSRLHAKRQKLEELKARRDVRKCSTRSTTEEPSISEPVVVEDAKSQPQPRRHLVRRLESRGIEKPAPIIDLLSSDGEPDAQETDAEDSYLEPVDQMRASEAEVLDFFNRAEVVDLLAFTSQSEANIKYFLQHKPFSSISAASNVTIEKEGRGKKRGKIVSPLGDDIVQAVWPSVTSIKATALLMKKGEARKKYIEKVVTTWNRDHTGRYKPGCGAKSDTEDETSSQAPPHSNGNTKASRRGLGGRPQQNLGSRAPAADAKCAENDSLQKCKSTMVILDSSPVVKYGRKQQPLAVRSRHLPDGSDVDDDDDDYVEKEETDGSNSDDTECRSGNNDKSDIISVFTRGPLDPETGLMKLPFSTPNVMRGHCVLKRHQKFGMNYLALLKCLDIPVILADEMGLGKTCTVISLVACIKENNLSTGSPHLIVVPPSTLNNWRKEFERFAPSIRVIEYRDADRAAVADMLKQEPETCDVLLTSYSQIGNNASVERIRRTKFDMAIFDEGHQHLKNKATQEWRRLSGLSSNWKLIMTGTPVQNNFQELICILAFLDPETYNDKMYEALEPGFKRQGSMVHISKGTLLAGSRADIARDMLAPYLLQRRKEEVALDVPPKKHRIVYCGMTEAQASIHNAAIENAEAGRGKGTKSAAINPYMKLKQAASHSLIVRHYFTDEIIGKMADALENNVNPYKRHLILRELEAANDFHIQTNFCKLKPCSRYVSAFGFSGTRLLDSGKTQALLRLLEEFKAEGCKTLVFSPFRETTALLCGAARARGFHCHYMAGDTPVDQRQALIDAFNAPAGDDDDGPSLDAFFLTTATGGAGVNLTAASKVIIYDMSDNPQDDIQAENRAHRIGQKKTVEVIRFITKGSIEETIFAATKQKIEMADKVTNWQGLRDLPTVVAGDAGLSLDDLLDVNKNEVQKRFVQMCARIEPTVKWNPKMDDDMELVL